MVKYLKKHKCDITTSLDGPKELHNTNRPLQDTTHTREKFEENIKMIREICGQDSVSALMTTSKYSLGHFKAIIDEYVRMGYNNIFLRVLNPRPPFFVLNACMVRNNVVTLQRDCRLITPAADLKPWVHISTEAIVRSATSSLMSMSIKHR